MSNSQTYSLHTHSSLVQNIFTHSQYICISYRDCLKFENSCIYRVHSSSFVAFRLVLYAHEEAALQCSCCINENMYVHGSFCSSVRYICCVVLLFLLLQFGMCVRVVSQPACVSKTLALPPRVVQVQSCFQQQSCVLLYVCSRRRQQRPIDRAAVVYI